MTSTQVLLSNYGTHCNSMAIETLQAPQNARAKVEKAGSGSDPFIVAMKVL
jgi:hypothetical protein